MLPAVSGSAVCCFLSDLDRPFRPASGRGSADTEASGRGLAEPDLLPPILVDIVSRIDFTSV